MSKHQQEPALTDNEKVFLTRFKRKLSDTEADQAIYNAVDQLLRAKGEATLDKIAETIESTKKTMLDGVKKKDEQNSKDEAKYLENAKAYHEALVEAAKKDILTEKVTLPQNPGTHDRFIEAHKRYEQITKNLNEIEVPKLGLDALNADAHLKQR